MNQIKKRIISMSVCFCLIFSTFCAYAVYADSYKAPLPLSAGIGALQGQFKRDAGPKVSGYSIEYSYFSPKKSAKDKTKYPLVICMGGAGSGKEPGMELTANNFAFWSSKEYQERFKGSKGAYILMARAPEPIYWDTAPIASLKAALDDFIAKNPNVDTTRIYTISWCIGCSGATRLAAKYPDFIAGMILHAPRHIITLSQAKKFENKAVWIICCRFDFYAIYPLYTLISWSDMKIKSTNRLKLRLTSCTYAPTTQPKQPSIVPPLVLHKVWNYTAYDMSNDGGCRNLKTIDGFGHEIESPTAIAWLSQWSTQN